MIEQNRPENHRKRKDIDDLLHRIRKNDHSILERKRIIENCQKQPIWRSPYKLFYWTWDDERQAEWELFMLSSEGSFLRDRLSSLQDEMHAPQRALERLQEELYQLEAPRDAERIRRHRMFTNGPNTPVPVLGQLLQNALETQSLFQYNTNIYF